MFDGRWSITMKSPMGDQQGELELISEGGSLNGTMVSPMGLTEITEGKVEGNQATWTVSVTQPMKLSMKFKATVEGDTMTGKAKAGLMPGGSFTGTRITQT
jgi:hypothetical protein